MRGRREGSTARGLAALVFVVGQVSLVAAQSEPSEPGPARPSEEAPAPSTPPADSQVPAAGEAAEGAPEPGDGPVGEPAQQAEDRSTDAVPAAGGAADDAAPGAGGSGGIVTNQQVRDSARTAYTEGQRLFDAGDYAGALAAFQQAYEAVPKPIVLLPIAECQIRLGDVPDAVATLERYLEERPDAPDRAEVEARLAELGRTPAMLTVASKVTGLRLAVDGTAVAVDALPFEMELDAGEHVLEAVADGYEPAKQTLTVQPGEQARWEPELAPVAEPEPAAVAVSDDDLLGMEPEDNTAALWVAGIVGASGLLAGSVLGFMALSENSDFDSEPSASAADRGERLALFSDVAFGVGAMALVTGAVLYLTQGGTPGEEEARRSFDMAATASPDGAFVTTTVRY